ncbi:MAG: hypothetical protein RL662_2261 [Bacteroidota bacterium]|jgi:hypothetical protein
MIHFKPIELSDKSKIDTCLEANIFRTCDFSFSNLVAWQTKFNTEYDIIHKTLFLCFHEENGTVYYMMPIGPMGVKEAIELMMSDAESHNIPFRMRGVSLRMWEIIQQAMPGVFQYTHDPSNDEYIYLSEKLITLSGKKLQSKRNHINRFKADNPNWEYFPLTSKDELEQCAAMLGVWEDTKDDKDGSLQYDHYATKLMLDNFDYLGLKGGAIRVNGKIVAFTIGEKLTDDIFVVHVEKAFGEMNGAYTIINQQFVQHEASEFKYINREEDMGIESLRKAKLSYQPDIILEEGFLTPISE